MIVPSLVRTEFRRLNATKLARMAFIALMTVPLLYGGLYLWGNSDPYGNLDKVPVALVDADAGATVDGKTVNYGADVAKDAITGGEFDWHRVSAATAAAGIRSGAYDFTITIPEDFSEDLASANGDDPTRATLTLTTNDTNSYLASTIAGQAATTIRTSIAQRVGKTAAKSFLVGLDEIRSDLSTASTGASKLASGTNSAVTGSRQLASGAAKVASGAAGLKTGADDAAAGAATLASGTQSLKSGAATLSSGATKLDAGTRKLANGLTTLKNRTATLPASTKKLNEGAKAVSTGAAQVETGTAQVSTGAGTVSTGAANLSTGADTLSSSLATLSSGATRTRAGIQARLQADGLTADQISDVLALYDPIATGTASAATGADTLATGADTLAAGAATVATGASTVAAGASTVASGASSVAGGTATLAASSASLKQGIASASSGANSVDAGADSVASGATKLSKGAAQVDSGADSLATGLKTLDSGASTLATGTSTLESGATSLANGSVKLHNGATKLASGLDEGIDAIPSSTADSRTTTADTISNPVKLTTDAVTDAGTYGAGLAPFFISLSAWIGMYALFLIVRPLSKRAITATKKPGRTVLAGWATPALLGIAQMIVLFAIVRGLLGIEAVHPLGTVAIMALAAVTFAAILGLLNVALGSVGQFLGLILMLIQLVTAGGTFPWQTLPGPLAAVHKALPMAYAVDALRQVMYGGELSRAWTDAIVLGAWLVGALLLTTLIARRMTRSRTLKDLRPSLIGG